MMMDTNLNILENCNILFLCKEYKILACAGTNVLLNVFIILLKS